ncbi:MAG TPA: hypothetical protein PK971_12315 [Saprospiraceae bacterium]|nr:hypothetical protein [Saprospiraceae bacterium]HNG89369.1 hypothetical protein [Saprospiraceae bacterium]
MKPNFLCPLQGLLPLFCLRLPACGEISALRLPTRAAQCALSLSAAGLWLLAATALPAQSPVFEWVKPIVDRSDPANTYADLFDLCTQHQTGETAVLGYFQGKIDFDAQHTLKVPDGTWAYFLAKYASDGSVQWVRKIGPINDLAWPSDTTGGSVALDEEGNVYVTAKYFSESLNLGNGPLLMRRCPSDCADAFVAKFSPEGLLIWAKNISSLTQGASIDADGLIWDRQGQLYLSGSYSNTELVYDESDFFTELSADGCFLARLSPDGNLQWLKTSDQQGIAVSEQLELAADGSIWWGGYYLDGEIKFGNNVGLGLHGNPDFVQYFLARYSPEGEAQEALNFNSGHELFFMPEIAPLPDTSLLIAHDFRLSLRQANTLLKQTPAHGAMLTRLKAGQIEQIVFVPYSSPLYDPASTPIASIATSDYGEIVTGGYFGTPSLITPAGQMINQGCSDIMLLSLTRPDSPAKGYRFGKNGCEGILNFYTGHSMRHDVRNALYICGLFAEEMSLGGVSQTGYGLFLAKVSQVLSAASSPAAAAAQPLRIQPNPSSGTCFLHFRQEPAEGLLTVCDALGRTVHSQMVRSASAEIRLSAPEGLYLCTFYGKKGVEQGRLLLLKE